VSERVASEVVTLRVNGQIHQGWQEVRITRGIERAAADFSLAMTTQFFPVKAGDAAEIYIGPDRVLTGFVDDVEKQGDAERMRATVAGRSRSADAVDSSAVHRPGQWNGVKIERIAATLAQDCGVNVVTEADTGAPIIEYRIQQCETVIAAIQRLCALRGLLASDDERGSLVLFRAANGRSGAWASPIRFGGDGNAKAMTSRSSQRDRFHSYIVKGQQGGFDLDDPAQIAGPEATAIDRGIRQNRRLVVMAETSADTGRCQDRAAWESAKRLAAGTRVEATVQGWRQMPGGPLWRANALSRVYSELHGIDADMLIVEVSYAIGEQGTETRMSLAPSAAFELLPEREDQGIGAFAGLLRAGLKK